MYKFRLLFFALWLSTGLTAQNAEPLWQETEEPNRPGLERVIIPKAYRVLQLNTAAMLQLLDGAPEESSTRVGQSTDYDQLVMEVWTSGAITPEDSVAHAAKIVKDHMQIFINFDEEPEPAQPQVDEKRQKVLTNLAKSVEELELSVRSYNCLKNANIQTISELVQKGDTEMLKTRNFGRKSLNEIKEILEDMGLGLGMKLEEDDLKQIAALRKKKEMEPEPERT